MNSELLNLGPTGFITSRSICLLEREIAETLANQFVISSDWVGLADLYSACHRISLALRQSFFHSKILSKCRPIQWI